MSDRQPDGSPDDGSPDDRGPDNDRSRPGKPPLGYDHARTKADGYRDNRERVLELLHQATAKSEQKRQQLSEVWDDLKLLLGLLRSWANGDYRGVSWRTIATVIAAVLYFVMPFDVVPDFISLLGFFDDAAVIGYVVREIRGELDLFKAWLESRESSSLGTEAGPSLSRDPAPDKLSHTPAASPEDKDKARRSRQP